MERSQSDGNGTKWLKVLEMTVYGYLYVKPCKSKEKVHFEGAKQGQIGSQNGVTDPKFRVQSDGLRPWKRVNSP